MIVGSSIEECCHEHKVVVVAVVGILCAVG